MINDQLPNVAGNTDKHPGLDDAMAWLRHQRRNAPVHSDVWHLRHHWERIAPVLQQQLQSGTYRLTPMQVVGLDRNAMWSAQDALVLKWVALQVTPLLPVHPRCEHVKGHGGGRTSIARLSTALQSGEYRYVCRTDIKGYYGAITKKTVMAQVRRYVADPVLLGLIDQYLHYTVEQGGEFYTPERGICRGCPLSPLIGAMHLYEVDAHFAREQETRGIVYARYMDDFIILAKSRWQLRGQVKALNGYLQAYGFIQHPDKTFIGRIEKGFDWMGAWLGTAGVEDIAPRALANHREKVRRLYERFWHKPKAWAHARVSQYRSRWKIWAVCLVAAIASIPSIASAGWTAYPVDASQLRACTPIKVLSWDSGPNIVPGAFDGSVWRTYGWSGGVAMTGSWPGGTNGPGAVGRRIPAGTHRVGFPTNLPTFTGCATLGSLYGPLSAGGHAVLTTYTAQDPTTSAYSSHAVNGKPYNYYSSMSLENFGETADFMTGPFGLSLDDTVIYTWPSGLYGGFDRVHCPDTGSGSDCTVSITSHLDIYLTWDGATLSGDLADSLSLPAGMFTGTDYRDPNTQLNVGSTPSPAVPITFVKPDPVCHLLVDGGAGGGAHAIDLGPISPTCAGSTCAANTLASPATTSIAVACTPASTIELTRTVAPVVDVSGAVDGTRSNWLLRTSQGNAVSIWGTTVPDDHFGCNYKGWLTGNDTWHGGVPFAAGKVWVPFPHDGSDFGVGSPWGSTASGWNGNYWQSKTATIRWGICLDPSAGAIQAGPFTATATMSLRIP